MKGGGARARARRRGHPPLGPRKKPCPLLVLHLTSLTQPVLGSQRMGSAARNIMVQLRAEGPRRRTTHKAWPVARRSSPHSAFASPSLIPRRLRLRLARMANGRGLDLSGRDRVPFYRISYAQGSWRQLLHRGMRPGVMSLRSRSVSKRRGTERKIPFSFCILSKGRAP